LKASIHQIELRHLRYVVAIAEDLHFARAADRLHLAAPSLSKQIRQLETVLGYPLFERKTRQVLLTNAGAAFVLEARVALNHVALAIDLSAAANITEAGAMAIGYSPWVDLPWIMRARESFCHNAASGVVLQSECSALQIEDILTGRLSAGIVILPIKTDGLSVAVLRHERLLLALPEGHALARVEAIAFHSLIGERFVSIPASREPALNEHLQELGRRNGFVLDVIHEVVSVSEALELVAAGIGITLVRASAAALLRARGVVFRECAEPLTVEVGLAYALERPPVALEQLVKLLRQPSVRTPSDPMG